MNASSSSQLTYYRPSGAAPVGGILVTLIGGVAAGVILGAVYAFVNHHDPIVYLNLLLAGCLGWALGWIVSKGVRAFRIRNTFAASAIALVVFAAAYTAHWPVYLATVTVDYENEDDLAFYDARTIQDIQEVTLLLVKDPELAWDVLRGYNEVGIWSIGKPGGSSQLAVKGIFLTLIWIAEALVIGWCALAVPREAAGKPYSERQDKWMEARKLTSPIAFIENTGDFLSDLARGDFSALTTPPQTEGEGPALKYATVTLYPDAFDPYISVQNTSEPGAVKKSWFKRWLSGSSKKETVTAEVVRYLKIPPAAAQSISEALGAGHVKA